MARLIRGARLGARPTWAALFSLLAAWGSAACERRATRVAVDGDDPVVASIDGVPVLASELKKQMQARSLPARAALEEIVRFELLAAAARSAGVVMGEDTATLRKSILVQRLIERDIEPRLSPEAIGEADVRALYERGRKRYVHGRMVQIAVLSIFTGAKMKSEARERARQAAVALEAEVKEQTRLGATADAAALKRLADDPAWSGRGVSFSTTWQDAEGPYPRAVADAALKLRRKGDTTALVGDETGYYIARHLDEKPPEDISFEEVAPTLRREMWEPWRKHRFLQLTADLAGGHEIEVFE